MSTSKELRVKDLIALLQKADPEALVFGEFEGDFFSIETDDVRVGNVALGDISSDSRPSWTWLRTSHPCVDGGNPFHYTKYKIKERAQGVLLWAGQSEHDWPDRLDGEPTEEKK